MRIEDYYKEEANKCKKCKGKISQKDKRCVCQRIALSRFRWDQLPIHSVYRSLDWLDFGKRHKTQLSPEIFTKARDMAFAYCFSKKGINEIRMCQVSDENISNILETRRFKQLQLRKRFEDGYNLVILGEEGAGKSLLASLVAREIIHSSSFIKDMVLKWVPFYELLAKLDFHYKLVDFSDDLTYGSDFLIIDDVHNPPGAINPLLIDEIIGTRLSNDFPTIVTIRNGVNVRFAGNELFRLINDPNTILIKLFESKIINDKKQKR